MNDGRGVGLRGTAHNHVQPLGDMRESWQHGESGGTVVTRVKRLGPVGEGLMRVTFLPQFTTPRDLVFDFLAIAATAQCYSRKKLEEADATRQRNDRGAIQAIAS